MLTEKDIGFIRYWEQNRMQQSTFKSKILTGLPMATLFSLPIILFVMVVWLFFPDWYMKISETGPGTVVTAIFAMMVVTLFYSYFRMQYKWENNEQLYKELKAKEKNTQPVNLADNNKTN